MKKIISVLALSITAAFVFNACSDSDMERRFPDPSKTSEVSVEKLMTGVFQKGNSYTMPWYWRYWTFDIPYLGKYSQVMGYLNSTDTYTPSESYSNNRWVDFYKMVANYRLLESTLKAMPEEDQPAYEVFRHVTRIFLYDHLQQVIDLWGDVPFTEAGYVGIEADITLKASYDKAEDLYAMMMADLKATNTFLAGYSGTDRVLTLLKEQDYINEGNLMTWRRYCNSLRARVACRAAENGSLTSEAQGVLKEIFSDPNTCPVVTTNAENIQIDPQGPDLVSMTGMHEEGIKGGFEGRSGLNNRATKPYIDALTGDPRLEILYDKNTEGEYVGIDPAMEYTAQDKLFNRPNTEGGNYFSAVDTATISRNNNVPGVCITASEVDFIRAEAILKWGVSGSVEDNFKAGVKKSIDFYYAINAGGDYRDPVTKPADSEINAFVEAKWASSTHKEELVLVQKWLHHGMIHMGHAWAEVRRTNYPKLHFEELPSLITPKPPVRLIYTTDERNNNKENYAKVQAQDTYYTKIFWAK